MKKLLTISFLVFILLSCETKTNPQLIEAEQLIERLKKESESVGWSVTVSRKGETIFTKGFGLGNFEQQVPVYPNKTRFRIGSISKALTAAGLGILIEQGKINLDVPVQTYAPGFPEKEYPITTRQVAGHIAGIRHYKGTEFLSTQYYKTINEGLDIFKDDSLLFEPGTSYSYSSYGFNLLSAAMEGASGETFLNFMDEQVFKPLDMTETVPDKNDSLVVFRAGFYSSSEGAIINAPYVDNSYKWAGGGFLSTTEDLVKFGNALLYNKLFSEETKLKLVSPQVLKNGDKTEYGMGFFTRVDKYGRPYYGHTGGSVGGCGNFLIYPEEELVVAVITNDSKAKIRDELHELAEIFMKKK